MASIQSIPGIEQPEVNALQNIEIKTREDFWAQLGNHKSEKIDALALRSRISEGRLIGLYASDLTRKSGFSPAWFRGFLLGLILLLALIFYINPALLVQPGFLAWFLPNQITGQVVANPAAGLKAHKIIEAKDLTTTRLAGDPGAFQDMQPVVGGYLLNDLNPGQVIRAADFVSAQDMAGRRVVSLAVAAGSIGRQLKPGTRITLQVLPRDPKNAAGRLTLPGAILLDLNPAANTISAALSQPDADALLPLLPTAIVYPVLE